MSDKKPTIEEIKRKVNAIMVFAAIAGMGHYKKPSVFITTGSKIMADGKEYVWLDAPQDIELGEIIESGLETVYPEGLYLEVLKMDDEKVIHMKPVKFFKAKLTDGVTTEEFLVAARDIPDVNRLLREYVKGTQYKKAVSITETKKSDSRQFYITETLVFGGGKV